LLPTGETIEVDGTCVFPETETLVSIGLLLGDPNGVKLAAVLVEGVLTVLDAVFVEGVLTALAALLVEGVLTVLAAVLVEGVLTALDIVLGLMRSLLASFSNCSFIPNKFLKPFSVVKHGGSVGISGPDGLLFGSFGFFDAFVAPSWLVCSFCTTVLLGTSLDESNSSFSRIISSILFDRLRGDCGSDIRRVLRGGVALRFEGDRNLLLIVSLLLVVFVAVVLI
jgi:hypothetical protein